VDIGGRSVDVPAAPHEKDSDEGKPGALPAVVGAAGRTEEDGDRQVAFVNGSSPRAPQRDRAEGAAAVEFALVSVIFFLLLFGILQYGLYFNDSLNTRQGVREAVRQGVVQMPISNSCGGAGVTWTKLDCYTRKEVGALTGDTKVHILAPDSGGWKKPNRLLVCAAVKSEGAFGMLPMPGDGVITSKTVMSIEQDSAPPSGSPTNSDPDPSGDGWAWCS
jgi:hypothetical protein